MTKTAILFSNPFGYGPTGALSAFSDEFSKRWKGKIVFAAGELSQEPFSNANIEVVNINERGSDAINCLLENFNNPYVVSFQNRFAVSVANKRKIPNVFIDMLTWFWEKIPEEYLISDCYYCINFPNIQDKIKSIDFDKRVIVPAIIGNIPKNIEEKTIDLLIYIGGTQSPLNDKLPESYLMLLADALNTLENHSNCIVCGGQKALDYLSIFIKRSNIKLLSLKREQFIETLSNSSRFVTTAGMGTTLEAFSIGIPTSFLLPINLSQRALVLLLKDQSVNPIYMLWEDYFNYGYNYDSMSEKEGIVVYQSLANQVLNDKKLKERVLRDTIALFNKKICSTNQKNFINSIGTNGAQVIVDDLAIRWSF